MFALLDMDSFYAQVESKRLGLSREVPLGVQQHGHFIAVNYAARERGVPSRCAVEAARALCPEIVAAEVEMLEDVKPSLERYRRASEAVLAVVQEFVPTDRIERASIDEAYIDLGPVLQQRELEDRADVMAFEKVILPPDTSVDRQPATERRTILTASMIMNQIREAILTKLGFTSSCGIAHNKMLAKISASKNKPAGQTLVFRSAAKHLMRTTPLTKIKGLGGKLGKQLNALYASLVPSVKQIEHGVLGAIQDGVISLGALEREFGTKTSRYIVRKAHGEDDSEVVPRNKPKTLLSIKQFYMLLDLSQVCDWLKLESEELAKRVKLDHEQFHRFPTTLVLHIYRNNGDKISRRVPFASSDYMNLGTLQEDIYRASVAVFRKLEESREGARGIGVALDNFEDVKEGSAALTVHRITDFFGAAAAQASGRNPAEIQEIVDDSDDPFDEDSIFEGEEGTVEVNDEFSSSGGHVHQNTVMHKKVSESRSIERESAPAVVGEAQVMDAEGFHNNDASVSGAASHHEPNMIHPNLGFAERTQRSIRPQTSREAGASVFVDRFFKASRLSFIGSWKRRFEGLLETLPEPPDLGPPFQSERVILHVDMDAFFCSASLLKRPDLRDKPVAVCWSNATAETLNTMSSAEISSCNYIARERGVKASMWLAKAKDLCPDLTCIPFDFELYENIGMDFYKLLFRLSPHVEGVSCDEAYIDVTESIRSPNDVMRICEELRANIFHVTGGVTASIGAGPNRLIARLCTKKAKPNKSFSASFWGKDRIFAVLLNESVPVGELPSIGWNTRERLRDEFNVNTVIELREIALNRLKSTFGPKIGERMYNLARGVDDRPWNPRPARDSVSVQISWGVRMQNQVEVNEFMAELAKECYRRLGPRHGDTVNLKVWRAVENQPDHMRKGAVGHGLCDILNRSRPKAVYGPQCTHTENKGDYEKAILNTSLELLEELKVAPMEIRGVGVSISGLAKKLQASSGATGKRQKVAVVPSVSSKYVEGVGVVANKRARTEASSPLNKKIDNPSESEDAEISKLVRENPQDAFSAIDHELAFAFEEAHCERWPDCGQTLNCGCFARNLDAICELARLIKKFVDCGATSDLFQYARWQAHTRYGVLPKQHPISVFTRAGGGLTALSDSLCDIEAMLV